MGPECTNPVALGYLLTWHNGHSEVQLEMLVELFELYRSGVSCNFLSSISSIMERNFGLSKKALISFSNSSYLLGLICSLSSCPTLADFLAPSFKSRRTFELLFRHTREYHWNSCHAVERMKSVVSILYSDAFCHK